MADNYVGISIRATDGAKPDLTELKAMLDALKGTVAEARAEVDDADADAKLIALQAKLESVSKQVARPRIDMAGAARALASVSAVDAAMRQMDADEAAQAKAAADAEAKAAQAAADAEVAAAEKSASQRRAILDKETEAELASERAAVQEQVKSAEAEAAAKAKAAATAAAAQGRADAAATRSAEKAADDMARAAEQEADRAAKAAEKYASQVEQAGEKSGKSFGEGFGSQGYMIGGGVVAALAALPALAAGGGAMAGIALGAGLLVGTSSVKGPLYNQFHSMTDGLMSVLRVAALPLVKPLGDAFAQVGKWAKALYPELHAVFGSLGPLVAPLTRGLEGLVQGVLPGFLRLMQSARPAVQAVSGLMSTLGKSVGNALGQLAPAVKASSQFLTGFGGVISNLLPVVIGLANMLAKSLGPWMETIGTKVAPILFGSILKIFNAVTPLLPSLSTLTGLLVQLASEGIGAVAGPLSGLIGALASLGARVLPSLIPPIQTLIGWLGNLVGAVNKALGLLSHIPGLGFLSGAASSAFTMPSFKLPASGSSSFASALASASGGGLGSWASGVTDPATTTGSTAVANAAKKQANELAQLGLQITSSFATSLSNSKSAGAVKSGVAKLLADVKTAWQDGIVSLGTDESLTKWLDAQSAQLQSLATKRASILGKIAEAKKFAASTASSVYGNYQLSDFATSGLNGQPATAGSIVSSLQADVSGVRAFAANIKKLAKSGLNKGYLNQLIQMGPVQGAALAAELANSGLGEIKAINSAEYQLSEASGQLGQTAANAMYDSGAQAGKGFLSGLQAQASSINKMMQTIAKNMVTTLRKELGIHSPSTVLRTDGVNSGVAVALGLEDTLPRIGQSMKKVAAAVRLPSAGKPGAAALGMSGTAGDAQKIQFEFTGSGSDMFERWFRQRVRVVGGGSVQKAYGS